MMRICTGRHTSFGLHVLSYVALTNILVHSYLEYHMPIWGYLGYTVDYSLMRHIIASFGAVCLALIIPTRMIGLTSYTLALVGSSTIAALLAMYATRGYAIAYLISVLIFLLIVRVIANRLRFRIPPRKSSSVPIIALSGGGVGLCVAWIAARGGLANVSFDIHKIYAVREMAMERYFVGPFAYLINWAQKALGTTLLALGIVKQSALLIAFAVTAQVFFYVALGQKTPVAMVVFVFISIAVFRYRPSVWTLNTALICLVIASELLIEWFGNDGLIMNSIFVKRIFFGPAENSILHFEFFSNNAFTFFSTTFLRGIVQYPFHESVFDLISIMRVGEDTIHPNVGVLGTGYQHMGYFGLFLYAVLSGFILAIFESLSKNLPTWVPLAIATPPLYIMFTSSDLPKVILTHGALIAMIILFIWPTKSVVPALNTSDAVVRGNTGQVSGPKGKER